MRYVFLASGATRTAIYLSSRLYFLLPRLKRAMINYTGAFQRGPNYFLTAQKRSFIPRGKSLDATRGATKDSQSLERNRQWIQFPISPYELEGK